MKRLILTLALLAAGAGAAMLAGGIGTAGAAQPPAVQNVREQNTDAQGNIKVHEQGTATVSVANTTLPVHEQGTVAATQSGAWHVSVDGKASVASADTTDRLGSYVGAPDGGGAFTEAVDADIASYKTIRVMTNCFVGGACANIAVNVYSIVDSRSYLLDTFPMQNFLAQTRTYDVPGESIAVQLQNNNASAVSNIGVAVFGRAN